MKKILCLLSLAVIIWVSSAVVFADPHPVPGPDSSISISSDPVRN